MPSYKTNDPKGWGGDPSRGAALGRHDIRDLPVDSTSEVILKRIPVDEGGYDVNGTYFGSDDPPLWWVADEDGQLDFVLRAGSEVQARQEIHKTWPNIHIKAPDTPEEEDYGAFIDAFLTCLLWSENDDDGDPFDQHFNSSDIHGEELEEIKEECHIFVLRNFDLIRHDLGHAGHDFCLTRNGHGAGFWDGGWGRATGDVLTKQSKEYGEVHPYKGDDGKLYVY